MKKVVVFDVENVLFDFKNVEKWMKGSEERMKDVSEFERMEERKKRERYLNGSVVKCSMYEGVRENVERLMSLRKSLEGRLNVFMVSEYRRELVGRLLSENGIEVDGLFGSIGKMMDESGYESKDVVYFSGSERRWCEGDVVKVDNVLCGWGKGFEEGLKSVDGIWKEIGVRVKVDGEKDVEKSCEESGEKSAESAGDMSEIKLNKDNIGEYSEIDVVGVLYRSTAGMSGDPGAVWIMDSEGRDIGFNISEDGIEIEDAEEVIPSLKLQGPFAFWQYLGMGDCLTVDLYKWRMYERRNLPVRSGSCYEGWKSTVEEIFRVLGGKDAAA